MITFRLVHSVPNPVTGLSGTLFGVGTLTGGFTQLTLLAGSVAGIGDLLGAISVEGNLVGAPAGIGALIGEIVAYNPGFNLGDSRNSALLALLEDI